MYRNYKMIFLFIKQYCLQFYLLKPISVKNIKKGKNIHAQCNYMVTRWISKYLTDLSMFCWSIWLMRASSSFLKTDLAQRSLPFTQDIIKFTMNDKRNKSLRD